MGSQKSRKFVKSVQKNKGQVVYGPPQRTDGWQPIDCGHLGANLKALGKEKFESWMAKPAADGSGSNWEKWDKNKFTTSEKRIAMTWVFGEAYEELCGKQYHALRRAAFEKGGCMITLSGKNDHLIRADNWGPVWPPIPGTPFSDEEYKAVAQSDHPDFLFIEPGTSATVKTVKKAMAAARQIVSDSESEASDFAAFENQDAALSGASESEDERAKELQTLYDDLFGSEEPATSWNLMESFLEGAESVDPGIALLRTVEGSAPRNS